MQKWRTEIYCLNFWGKKNYFTRSTQLPKLSLFVYLTMPKAKETTMPQNFSNPFLGPDRDKLWEKLDNDAKPISKEELLKRVNSIKEKGKR